MMMMMNSKIVLLVVTYVMMMFMMMIVQHSSVVVEASQSLTSKSFKEEKSGFNNNNLNTFEKDLLKKKKNYKEKYRNKMNNKMCQLAKKCQQKEEKSLKKMKRKNHNNNKDTEISEIHLSSLSNTCEKLQFKCNDAPVTPGPTPGPTTPGPTPGPTVLPILAPFQNILTSFAQDWEYFEINNDSYLAVANYQDNVQTTIESVIYQWNATSMEFQEHQRILTNGARDWEAFVINGTEYLALANYDDYSNSKIYEFNCTTGQFFPLQSILTYGARDWEFFEINNESYLVVANNFNIDTVSYNTNSTIYQWNTGSNEFQEFQTIPTIGAFDWEFFEINGDSYLVVANDRDSIFNTNVTSVIYQWNAGTDKFQEFQSIQTLGAHDWEFFEINGDSYLAVANFFNEQNYTVNIDSVIYKWNPTSNQFESHQMIPTSGAYDWEFLESSKNGQSYLVVADNQNDTTSVIESTIYEFNPNSNQFVPYQSILTYGATDWESFEINGETYLAVANSENTNVNPWIAELNSVIYGVESINNS